ncbi:orange carotenoid protein N-terminal domain-containing protein [Tumidithrix elongata RA019]|uniref:Orange carotenoid protein N-terminal domain-containing protein n=1 Tax=Tumidithrix elongata BACA0141 TaxID=2716417 RepID=A0AAW9PTW8_9CYAN|nr:orange carotenoid protein N-terminal domain-containing protein [Tumidithrix elongata RA019]
MTYTTDSTQSFIASLQSVNEVSTVSKLFKQLSADDQLAILWYAYTECGKSITPAAPGAARLQLAAGLIEKVKTMTYTEQLQFMRDLVNRVDTPDTRAYGVLSVNTKLGFWYVLAELMTQGIVVPVPSNYQMSQDVQRLLGTISSLDFGQQITILRSAVVAMGYDPLA